jgi:hypothetical protein
MKYSLQNYIFLYWIPVGLSLTGYYDVDKVAAFVTYFSVYKIKNGLLVWFYSARVNIHLDVWNLCKILAYQKCVTCISGPVTHRKEIHFGIIFTSMFSNHGKPPATTANAPTSVRQAVVRCIRELPSVLQLIHQRLQIIFCVDRSNILNDFL